ncbi:hypothetical protein Fmac_004904 [Flemingia macrophylla]|uniref:Uncharacterized protein n=1 Tax=Flemingia macrophylla TaxID=520843 RepID=A0ABD1N6F2_9FABA
MNELRKIDEFIVKFTYSPDIIFQYAIVDLFMVKLIFELPIHGLQFFLFNGLII